jgi:hypothetical protein
MGLFAATVLLIGALVISFGPEEHRAEFGRRDAGAAGDAG